jgi:hypothetical protein
VLKFAKLAAAFVVVLAIVGTFLSSSVYAHENSSSPPLVPGQDSEARHCIIYLTAVTLEKDIDPNYMSAALEGIEISSPEFGGCYDTLSEALRVGTNGEISLPDSTPRSEINSAILQHQNEKFSMPSNMTALSPTVVAIGYDFTNYQYQPGGNTWTFLDRSGTGCNPPETQTIGFPDYRIDPTGANDDMESIVPYADCDSIWVYQHPNYTSPHLYFFGPTASFYNPYTSVNLNNLVSSSIQSG